MENTIKFIKKILMIGSGSKGVILPIELLNYLDMDKDDEAIIIPDSGKHGKFISFWKRDKEE